MRNYAFDQDSLAADLEEPAVEDNDGLSDVSVEQGLCKTPPANKENALEFEDDGSQYRNASCERPIGDSDRYSNSEVSEEVDEKYVDAPDRILEGLLHAKIDI